MQDFLDTLAEGLRPLPSSSPVGLGSLESDSPVTLAVCNQEHWQYGLRFDLFRENLRRYKWHTVGSPARCTAAEAGSAGVCISAPLGRSRLAAIPGMGGYDFSPKGDPGRICATWVELQKGAGLNLVNIYFHHNDPSAPLPTWL